MRLKKWVRVGLRKMVGLWMAVGGFQLATMTVVGEFAKPMVVLGILGMVVGFFLWTDGLREGDIDG